MKIGYFADGPWSHLALDKILQRRSIELAFICVRNNSNDQILPIRAQELGIPCLKHHNVNSDEFLALLKTYGCDLMVSMSFDQIFKKSIIELTPGGIINCHAGKLPFYRGRNILNWALINDEREFGITVHYVDTGIDTGDIILQRDFIISDNDTYATLLERAYHGCAEILDEALELIFNGKAERIPQTTIHPIGSYCGRRISGDEIINWNQTSRELFNFVRAICAPGPKATTHYNGPQVTINRISLLESAPTYKGFPGQILAKTAQGWLVKSADSFVEIREVDLPSGLKLKTGDRFK